MNEKYKRAYGLLFQLCEENEWFKKLIEENIEKKMIRFFSEEEWNKIESQNYIPPRRDLGFNEFSELFELGYNIGNCVDTSRQLSYSYNDVDIVSGILPILKGTRNAEKEGGHCWLENKKYIIDTSLLLVIDKSIKSEFGYIEEERRTHKDLFKDERYQQRKEFVNDKSLNKSRK